MSTEQSESSCIRDSCPFSRSWGRKLHSGGARARFWQPYGSESPLSSIACAELKTPDLRLALTLLDLGQVAPCLLWLEMGVLHLLSPGHSHPDGL